MPSPTTTARAFAPAKINLTLHVTGRRADGYHDLDSLVVFADVGDRVTATRAPQTTLTVTGPRAEGVPLGADNLVLRAAALMPDTPASLILDKQLPAAAGIGGGSSDAAATLRALADLGGTMPDAGAVKRLGSDVPVCLANRPARMRGIGDDLQPLTGLPECHLVLVNPGLSLATPDVFRALDGAFGDPMPDHLPAWSDALALAAWLAIQRNDLEAPARRQAPVIGQVLVALGAQRGCLLARMSGSGATCFGLFTEAERARAAARALRDAEPQWWVASARAML